MTATSGSASTPSGLRLRAQARFPALFALAISVAPWLASCALAPREELELILGRDAGYASLPAPALDAAGLGEEGPLPEGLPARLLGAKVFLVGETHYVQEHQEFWGSRAGALADAGFAVLAEEGMSSLSWIAEAAVSGEWPGDLALPVELEGFDRELLARIGAVNAARRPRGAPTLALALFDMNHWPSALALSLQTLARLAENKGDEAAAAEIRARLAPLGEALVSGSGYSAALEALAADCVSNPPAPWLAGMAEPWRSRLAKAVALEAESAAVRRLSGQAWDDAREDFIERRVEELLAALGPGRKLALNCGMYHAQERKIMGSTRAFIGTRLARGEVAGVGPGESYSLACSPVAGERQVGGYASSARRAIDLAASAPANDLVRLLGEFAGERVGYLPLEDPLFARAAQAMSLGAEPRTASPPLPFDALLSYPRASVTRSLDLLR